MQGRSDVDSVGMFLAQRLVFFGEERLTFQISLADLWREQKLYRAVLLFTQYSPHVLIFIPSLLLLAGVTVSWTYRTHKAGVMPGES